MPCSDCKWVTLSLKGSHRLSPHTHHLNYHPFPDYDSQTPDCEVGPETLSFIFLPHSFLEDWWALWHMMINRSGVSLCLPNCRPLADPGMQIEGSPLRCFWVISRAGERKPPPPVTHGVRVLPSPSHGMFIQNITSVWSFLFVLWSEARKLVRVAFFIWRWSGGWGKNPSHCFQLREMLFKICLNHELRLWTGERLHFCKPCPSKHMLISLYVEHLRLSIIKRNLWARHFLEELGEI